jgi:hypothetical protein
MDNSYLMKDVVSLNFDRPSSRILGSPAVSALVRLWIFMLQAQSGDQLFPFEVGVEQPHQAVTHFTLKNH